MNSDAKREQEHRRGPVEPRMSEQEIRQAGLAVEVPYEMPEPTDEPLQYEDLGKTWTPPPGWPPTTESGVGGSGT